jgi:uncharacterized protein (TIGR04222 family)
VVSLHTEPMQDTWGISGPDFIRDFAAALAIIFVVALTVRLRITRSSTGPAERVPTPTEVAMLAGGRGRAVYSALAALRAAGVVGPGESGVLSATGPAPAGVSRLEFAVYSAATRQARTRRLEEDYAVRPALDELTQELTTAGWLLDPEQRRRARLGAYLVLTLGAVGVARIVAGLGNNKPVSYIVLLTMLTFVIGLCFMAVPRASAAGRAAVAAIRGQHAHLAPKQSPAWSTYGMTGAAMGVALYGTSAIWAADPSFAAQAGVIRDNAASGTSSSGCGGGCGGGGCGGGCGG